MFLLLSRRSLARGTDRKLDRNSPRAPVYAEPLARRRSAWPWVISSSLSPGVSSCLSWLRLPHHNGTPAVPGQMNARGVLKCRCSHQYAARTLRQSNPYTHRRDLACWLKLTDAAFKARENTRPLRVSKYRLSPQSTRGCTGVAGRWGVELVNYWSMEQLAACGSCGFGALVGLWENHGRRGLLNTEPDCAHRDKKLN